MIEIKRDRSFVYHLVPKEQIIMILQQRRLGRLNGKRMKLLKR